MRASRARAGERAEVMASEKRKSKRRQIGQRAWIDLGLGSRVFQCLVKDMSDTGARLAFAVPGQPPDEFVLQFAPDGSVGRRCQVVWRSRMEVGVKFLARILKGRRGEFGVLDC
jgi:hypothetical protein